MKLDGHIDLDDVCEQAGWHRATAISILQDKGIAAQDAIAFVAFTFADRAEVCDEPAGDLLTAAQWDRLT